MNTPGGAIVSWDEAADFQKEVSDPIAAAFVGYALAHLANYYANRGKPIGDFDAAFFAAVAAEMVSNKVFLIRMLNGDVGSET